MNFACWNGNKSTKGDLFYFNNAKKSMGYFFYKNAWFLPQFFVRQSTFNSKSERKMLSF